MVEGENQPPHSPSFNLHTRSHNHTMQPDWVQAVHTLTLPYPGRKPESAPLQQSLGQLSHWKPRSGRIWQEGLQSRLYLGIARIRRGSELKQIPTSSLRRPAKTVKNTALGLRSPLSLRLLTQEVQNIRLQLYCSGLITGQDPGNSPPGLTPSVCWEWHINKGRQTWRCRQG